ncbi:Uncharacterised protein [Bacteroides heparinolyticus]|uniref:Uncharacterized protein n=1 Tax=Prevotella heparinolytica TaxID=28113 RepID=A0A449I6K6_9BACE|nr:Uncharacterised protein [Bacteroides heparinolyticus]
MNWSHNCENRVSILFLALAKARNTGFHSFRLHLHGTSRPDIGGFKQIQLHLDTYISFVPYDSTITIVHLHILQVMNVMHTCLW